MSFIRVTLRSSKDKVDLNTAHIVSFREGVQSGTEVSMVNGDLHLVNESTRQIRSFIKKAQGTLPQASATE